MNSRLNGRKWKLTSEYLRINPMIIELTLTRYSCPLTLISHFNSISRHYPSQQGILAGDQETGYYSVRNRVVRTKERSTNTHASTLARHQSKGRTPTQMDRLGSNQTPMGSPNDWPPSRSHGRTRSIPNIFPSHSNPTSPITPSSPLASVDMLVGQSTGFVPSHGRNRSMGGGVLMSPAGTNASMLGAEHEWAGIQAR